jgi:outer membrane protein assembly factor BamC
LENYFFRFLLIALFIAVLPSCALFNRFYPDKSLDYQKHESHTELKLPEGISTTRISDSMPVPEIDSSLKALPLPEDVEQPAPLKLGMIHLGVQKRSAGERSWLFIDKSASQVWPELLAFFEEKSISLKNAEPSKGLAESEWQQDSTFVSELVSKANEDTEISEKESSAKAFRIFVELQPGLQRNTARLQLVLSLGQGEWPKVSDSLVLENLLLDELAAYLGEKLSQKKSVSLLAQKMERKFEVDLFSEGEEQPYILVNQDFNHTWYLTGNAIRKSAMPLFDINRSLALFYLSTEHEDAEQFDFTRKIKNNPAFSKLEDHGDFLVYVNETESGSEIKIKISDEKYADKDFSNFVLKALLPHINPDDI